MRPNKRLKTSPSAPDHRQDFELAIICALPLEADAVIGTFDYHWVDQDKKYGKAAGDPNAYTTGVIGSHNVVVAHMPGMGKVSAAGVAVGLRMSFPGIKLALVVGICGGVPSGPHERELYLGDVVISQCLIQYDFGRQYPEGFEPKGTIQGGSGIPSVAIQAVLCKLETDYHSAKLQEDTVGFLGELQGNSVRARYPGAECDRLFKPSYLHQHRELKDCATCGKHEDHACAEALALACEELGCGGDGLAHRKRPLDNERSNGPFIHFGKMGSGDTVMKSGTHRDEIAKRDGIIAFEMEGAGIYAHFPSLMIKGVCDYADCHKNKQWQDYAAATAAACTKAFLKRWISSDDFYASEARPAMKPTFMVDIMRDNVLIGREDVMHFLTEKLSSEGHNRVALVALGGTGKTRIALEYAMRLKTSLVSVFWIHASTKARILDCYAKIAIKANIVPHSTTGMGSVDPLAVKEWFESEASGRWLIILDNTDDHDLLYGPSRLIDIFPRSENGSILLTTRDRKVGYDFAGASRMFHLQRLGSDQAQELLRSNMGDEIDWDLESCKRLCEELEGIPLAIIQAAAFMHQKTITAQEYLKYYQESSDAQISLLSEDFEDSVRDKDSKNPIAATWVISFDYIERKIPLAAEILKTMSILEPHAIPTSLIETGEHKLDFIKAIGTLQAFCLISARVRKVEKTYALHRLVRLALRNWLKQRGLLDVQAAKVLKMLAENYPGEGSTLWKDFSYYKLCALHANAVLSLCEADEPIEGGVAPVFAGQSMMAAHSPHDVLCAICASDLMMKVSYISYSSLYRNDWVRWSQAALRLRTFVLGPQHQRTIEALSQAFLALYVDGQFDKAQELGERAVQLIEVAPDCPPSLIARKFEIQGYLRMALGELPDEYISKALEILDAEVSSTHSDTVRLKLSLSESYQKQGRYAEFDELAKEVVESYQRIYGPRDPETLTAKTLLGYKSAVVGRDTEALVFDEETTAFEASESKADILYKVVILLGRVQYQASIGNIAEAVKSGLQMFENYSDLDPMNTITKAMVLVMELVATLHVKLGQNVEGGKLRIEVMKHRMKTETEDSPKLIGSIQALADHYEATGLPAKATPLRKRVLKLGMKKLGRRSPTVILYSCELGLNYSFQGQHDKAASYRYSVLRYPLERADAKLPDNIKLMTSIARRLTENYDYIEAHRVASDAVRLARMHERATQHEFTTCFTCLAATCSRLNKTRDAEELYREAIDIMGSQNGILGYHLHKVLLITMTNLAGLLLQQARYPEAEELAASTREKMLQLEYPDHEHITFNSMTLAAVYAEQGRYYLAELRCSDMLRYLHGKAWKPEHLTPSSIFEAVDLLGALALTYERAQRYQEASNIYGKTVAIREQLKGSDSMHTLEATALYRDTMNSQARYPEALELGLQCKELYQRREKSASSFEEMILVNIDRGIAVSLAGLGRYTDAEPLARQALETCSRIIGGDHPHSLHCLAALTWILREKNDANLSEVKDMAVGLLEKWIVVVGEKHLRTAEAMEMLAMTCAKSGDLDEAASLRRKAKEIRAGLDVGLEGEEKKELDNLVLQLLERWDSDQDELAEALARLRVG